MAGQRVGRLPSLSLTVPQTLLVLGYRTHALVTLHHRQCPDGETKAAAQDGGRQTQGPSARAVFAPVHAGMGGTIVPK